MQRNDFVYGNGWQPHGNYLNSLSTSAFSCYGKIWYFSPLDRPYSSLFYLLSGFLELINNMLTSGMVPALFPDDEKEGIIGQVSKDN